MGAFDDLKKINIAIAITDFIKSFVKHRINKSVVELMKDGFLLVEETDNIVERIEMGPEDFNLLKQNHELFDANFQRDLIITGNMGTFWGAQVYVQKDKETITLLGDHGTKVEFDQNKKEWVMISGINQVKDEFQLKQNKLRFITRTQNKHKKSMIKRIQSLFKL